MCSVPTGTIKEKVSFVYIAGETQKIMSCETMPCHIEQNSMLVCKMTHQLGEQNDTLVSSSKITGRGAAESTLLTYRVVKQYRVRFVCKAKDPSKKITQNNLTSTMDQCVFEFRSVENCVCFVFGRQERELECHVNSL